MQVSFDAIHIVGLLGALDAPGFGGNQLRVIGNVAAALLSAVVAAVAWRVKQRNEDGDGERRDGGVRRRSDARRSSSPRTAR